MAEAKVKLLTGGDTISARQLYGKPFDYRPNFKLWWTTNELPRIDGTNDAIWRRLEHVIRFKKTVPKDKIDPELSKKLIRELPGILNFSLEGYRQWKSVGLSPPEEVLKESENYRNESDTVGAFIDACCIKSKKAVTSTADLFSKYEIWCDAGGLAPLSKPSFGKTLATKDFEAMKGRKGNGWKGLSLKADCADPANLTFQAD